MIYIIQLALYKEYQRELAEEMKAKVLTQEELDDGKPSPMTPEQVIDLLKGHKFRFSLGANGEQVKDYLIEARKISE